MKKRILSALLTLGMVLTMLPTAWAVDGTSGNKYGPEDDSIRIEIGEEITLTGTEGATNSWTYHAGNGYLDDGMVLTSGEESEDTNQVSFQFTKAGTYSVTHIYRKNAGDFLVKSDAFKITVVNVSPTVADLEMYTEYTETDTLPIDAASATFAYVLTYHGIGGFGGVDPSFGSEGSIAMEATLTAANEKVRLVPVDKENLDLELPQGYYKVRYDNAADSDAGSQVNNEETIYFQVTEFGAINVGSSGLASDGGKSKITSKNVPKYSTITLNSGVFEDVATEEPGPEPSEYAAYIPQADGESVYYTQLDTALSEALSGETVVLCKDLTDVAVTVDKSITLDLNGHTISGVKHKSVDTGSSTTPQPGNPDPAAITIGSNATGAGEADQPKIESFTLKNGTISVGTGLRLYDDLTALTVENVIFRNNVASNAEQKAGGAAVHWRAATNETVEGTSATFVDCKFLNNSSGYQNGGSPEGGAVALNCVGNVQFTNCTFTGNKSNGTDSNGSPNGTGGAVYLSYCGNTVFDGCEFSENAMDSASGGGAVHTMWCGDMHFTGCTFTNNRSEGGAGGALALTYSADGANNVIENCTFTGNTAANGGGAMWISEADVELDANTVVTQNSASAGGAIMLQGNANAVVNCDLSGNSATKNYGGAAWVYGQASLTVNGNIENNEAVGNGGAVYAQWGNYYDAEGQKVGIPTVTITGDVIGNTSGKNGGAIYSNIANVTVTGAITGNSAGGIGGGIYSYNGAPEAYSSEVNLLAATVYNNEAETAAADIYHNGGVLTFSDVSEGWTLDECGHAIDGWYNDGEEYRWSAHGNSYVSEFTEIDELTGVATITGTASLRAAHGQVPIDPGEVPEDTWETSKSKTATNLNADYQSQVTLSLPASEEELVSDVVFILDKSTSSEVEDQAIQMLEDLNKQIADTGAKVKVGAVIFNKEANRVLELTELNGTTMDAIVEAIQTEISSGTNTHAGLLAGEAMLDADTSVDANRKYLIFVSDGITYMYNEEPTAIGLQNGDKTNIFAGPDNWATKYGSSAAPDDWAAWLKEIESLLETDSGYDYPYGTEFNGTDHQYIAYDDRANHAMSVDKALYLTYQTYQEIAAKYHCYSMVGGSNAASSHPWATSFMTYLSNGETVTFDEIQKDIYYLLDEGSSVKDVIGYGEDYNFDFINSLDALTLTVGGEKLDKEELIDPSYTDPYVTSAYGFGPNGDGTYQFVLNYYEKGEDGQSDECFVWEINVPVSNFAPVQLTYTVQLTNPKTESGTYGTYDADGSEGYDGLYTNNEATLYPVDSNGVPGQAENFYRPTVSYTVGTVSITPADITIYTGGDGYDSVVNGSGNEIGTTSGWRSSGSAAGPVQVPDLHLRRRPGQHPYLASGAV